jgi:hypothetical protein
MWSDYKGLETTIGLNDTTTITNLRTDCGNARNSLPGNPPGSVPCNWWEDYNEWLVTNQNGDGSWNGYWNWVDPLATAFDINILGAIQIPINKPPVAMCQNVIVSADSSCQYQGTASIDNGSYDPDSGDTITITQDPAGPYSLGPTTVTLTVTDSHGASSTCGGTVTVVDTTPPSIVSLSANPNSLWPPNHKMVPVTVTAIASDNCTAAPACHIVSVSSNEPENGLGDGDTAPDWKIAGNLTVNLRAERSGTGSGRIYTITTVCTDASNNNSSSGTVTVKVPHNM